MEELENELKESNGNFENLQLSFLELTEVKHILQKTQLVMSEESARDSTSLVEGENCSSVCSCPPPYFVRSPVPCLIGLFFVVSHEVQSFPENAVGLLQIILTTSFWHK